MIRISSSKLLRATTPRCYARPLNVSFLRQCSYSTSSTFDSFDVDQFCESFVNNVQGVAAATDPAQSSRELRKLVKSKSLMFTDMQENPEKFFMAHRLLSTVGK